MVLVVVDVAPGGGGGGFVGGVGREWLVLVGAFEIGASGSGDIRLASRQGRMFRFHCSWTSGEASSGFCAFTSDIERLEARQ